MTSFLCRAFLAACFSFSPLNISCHALRPATFLQKISAYYLIGLPFYGTSCFPLSVFEIVSLSNFWLFNFNVSLCGSLSAPHVGNSHRFFCPDVFWLGKFLALNLQMSFLLLFLSLLLLGPLKWKCCLLDIVL